MYKKRLLIISAYLLSTFVFSINEWFSTSGLYMLLGTILILALCIFVKDGYINLISTKLEPVLITSVIFFTALLASLGIVDINGFLSAAMWINRLLLFAVVGLAISYFFSQNNSHLIKFVVKYRYSLILLCGLVIYLTAIRIVKTPSIDVYSVLRYGPLKILDLQNPYEITITTTKSFTYGPAAIFLFLPVDLLFQEPRYLLIVSLFVTTGLIYYLAKATGYNKTLAELLSLMYLFHPKQLFFLTWSMIDSLIIALIVTSILFIYKKKYWLSGIFIGLILGIKMLYLPPLLFLLKLQYINKKAIILGIMSTILLVHLPFLFNWRALYRSLITINVGPETLVLRKAGLTFATFLDRQFHWYPPDQFIYLSVIILFMFLWLVIPKIKTISQALMAISFAFTLFIFFGPLGMANYYFTGGSFILLALVFLNRGTT